MSQQTLHQPVMLDEVIDTLGPRDGGFYIDATFGNGGYSRAILQAANCHLMAIDQDPDAIERGQPLISEFAPRFNLRQGRFSQMAEWADEFAPDGLDGIVFDLGVCSTQLDQAERGFSFQKDGPLDMRMSQSGTDAADFINQADEKDIADVLYHYGDERASRRIANAIIKARAEEPITRTLKLAEIIRSVLPYPKPGQSDPATRSFQALRIYINEEMREIDEALIAAQNLLRPDGILVVVTFHSLEDRHVKRFLTKAAGKTANPSRHVPEVTKPETYFALLGRKPQLPTDTEIASNPRSRSAKLRAARRLADEPTSLREFG